MGVTKLVRSFWNGGLGIDAGPEESWEVLSCLSGEEVK
jgi:hypothetical protein